MRESTLKKKVLKIAAAGLRTTEAHRVESHYTIICYLFCGLFIIYLWGYSRISLGLVKNPVKEHPDIPIYKKNSVFIPVKSSLECSTPVTTFRK